MQHEDGDEEHDQRLLDIRNAVYRARHRVEEPHGDPDGPRRDDELVQAGGCDLVT